MVHARLPRRLVTFFMAHLVQHLVMLASWWVVGNAALQGHFDRQWLLAWVLLLLSQVPLSVLVSWTQGTFAIGVGALLKLRLLVGALRLEPEEIRHQGAGQLLGQVIESGAVESMALSAGFSGVMAVVELISAGVVLSVGTGGGVRLLLFAAWIILTCVVGWRYFQQRTVWTTTRLEMTNDLVERMVGHRTRIAQERRERWHDGEDQLLSRYLDQSGDLDRTLVRFSVLLSRGWMVVGLLGLLPIVLGAGAVQALAVALALGGIVLASRALGTLAGSIGALTGHRGGLAAGGAAVPRGGAGERRGWRGGPRARRPVGAWTTGARRPRGGDAGGGGAQSGLPLPRTRRARAPRLQPRGAAG